MLLVIKREQSRQIADGSVIHEFFNEGVQEARGGQAEVFSDTYQDCINESFSESNFTSLFAMASDSTLCQTRILGRKSLVAMN